VVLFVHGHYHYHFAALVFSRKLSPQRLGHDPLEPRHRVVNQASP